MRYSFICGDELDSIEIDHRLEVGDIIVIKNDRYKIAYIELIIEHNGSCVKAKTIAYVSKIKYQTYNTVTIDLTNSNFSIY